jgi:hypothetical protein
MTTALVQNIWLIVLAGAPALMAAFLSFVGVLLTLRGNSKIEEIHISVNSRMDQLLKITSNAEYAKGQLAGPGETSDETKGSCRPCILNSTPNDRTSR